VDTLDAGVPEGFKEGADKEAAKSLTLDLREQVDMEVCRVVVQPRIEHGLRVVTDADHPLFK